MKEQEFSPAETHPTPGVYKSYLEYREIWFWNSSALEGGYADDYRLRPWQPTTGNNNNIIIILMLEGSQLVAYELWWLHRVQARKYKTKRSKLKSRRRMEGSVTKKFVLEAIIQVARSLGTKSLVDTNQIFSLRVCLLHSLTLTWSHLKIISSVSRSDLPKRLKGWRSRSDFEGIDRSRKKIISVGRAWEMCSVKTQFGLISQW